MFSLIAKITLKVKNNEFINKKDINNYLENICAKSIDNSLDDYEIGKNNIKTFNMNCNKYKNKVHCYIECNSYEESLQVAQGILKLDVLKYKNCGFEVNSLQLKEVEKLDMNYDIAELRIY